ncbi:MAG: hypothetical protein IE909_19285, partial [Campylobacterales bacterium]|nr:hypothetical protein [Campylobacterales bacterium]
MSLSNTTEIIIGTTGSGKSYLLAKFLKDAYDKKERPIFTNVNLKIPYDDYIKDLNVDDLYQFAKDELELYRKFQELSKEHQKKLDDLFTVHAPCDFDKYFGNYDKYLQDSGLLSKFGQSAIFWDEIQEDLKKDGLPFFDEVWARFFAYRRHFGIHLIGTTQDKSLIHRRYWAFFNKWYMAQP